MIEKSKITQLVEQFLPETEFLVDVEISKSNNISITIDSEKGIGIDSCIKLSKKVEEVLDRDEEDFELQVSSAGLGSPLKVFRQFVKNIDKEVEVQLVDGTKLEGILKSVTQEGFEIESMQKVKVDGKKKKELQIEQHMLSFEEAKTVKNIIKF